MTVRFQILNHQTGQTCKERSQVKHLDRRQQGNEKQTQMMMVMTMVMVMMWGQNEWDSNDCSLDVKSAFVTGKTSNRDQPALSCNTRLLDMSLSSTSNWLRSLFSWGGDRVWIWGWKSQQDPHYPASAPQTQVCVHEGSRHHVCIACLGSGPSLSVESWGQARCTQWNPKNEHVGWGVGGGGSLEENERGVLHLCVVTLLWRLYSDLVKGDPLPTSSLPWPWQWPHSQLSILMQGCLKAVEY